MPGILFAYSLLFNVSFIRSIRLIHCRTKNKLTMNRGRTLTLGSVDRNYLGTAQELEGSPYRNFIEAIDFETKTFGFCEITTEHAVCLGIQAFIRVLTRCNYPLYHDIIKYLRNKLDISKKLIRDEKAADYYECVASRCDDLIDSAVFT